jgi:hypothetical protein
MLDNVEFAAYNIEWLDNSEQWIVIDVEGSGLGLI